MSEIRIDVPTLKQNSQDLVNAIKNYSTCEKEYYDVTENVFSSFNSDFSSCLDSALSQINTNSLAVILAKYAELLVGAIEAAEKLDKEMADKSKGGGEKGKGK